jgi:hypothetical protein
MDNRNGFAGKKTVRNSKSHGFECKTLSSNSQLRAQVTAGSFLVVVALWPVLPHFLLASCHNLLAARTYQGSEQHTRSFGQSLAHVCIGIATIVPSSPATGNSNS